MSYFDYYFWVLERKTRRGNWIVNALPFFLDRNSQKYNTAGYHPEIKAIMNGHLMDSLVHGAEIGMTGSFPDDLAPMTQVIFSGIKNSKTQNNIPGCVSKVCWYPLTA